jgi:hypothetical protein
MAANESSLVLVGPSGVILQSDDMRPRLRLERGDDAYQLILSGLSNCLYRIEFSTDLVDWTAGWTNRIASPEVPIFQTSAIFPQRFYKAQLIPQ